MVTYLFALLLYPISAEFTAQITGTGTVSSHPDIAFVPISVRSHCYTDKEQENFDHSQIVQQVQDYISQLGPEVFTFPVYMQKPQDLDRTMPRICQNLSSRLTKVTLRSDRLENFYDYIFAQIQRYIPSRNIRQGDGIDSPYTYATVETPWGDLYEETRKNLQLVAKERAVEDAKRIVESYAKGLGYIGEAELADIIDSDQISSNNEAQSRLFDKEFSKSMQNGFNELEISTKLRFRFKFDGTSRSRFSALECEK